MQHEPRSEPWQVYSVVPPQVPSGLALRAPVAEADADAALDE
jgi:hypothetical protein